LSVYLPADVTKVKTLTAIDPGGNPLIDYQYTYDPTGNIVTKATEHRTYRYDYDASSRLTGVDNPVLDDESYTYDAVGNRLTSAEVMGNWNYNANNGLLDYADVEYDYDENGNMTPVGMNSKYTDINRIPSGRLILLGLKEESMCLSTD
jgi:YD repeat-containing protein